MAIQYRFTCRRRTAADWTSLNEVLLLGEIGLERDTNQFKFGNGSAPWNSLPYYGSDIRDILISYEGVAVGNLGDIVEIDFVDGLSATLDSAGVLTVAATGSAEPPFDMLQNSFVHYGMINSSTSATFIGFNGATLVGIGAADAETVASTSIYTRHRRLRYRTTSAAAGLSCGYAPGTAQLIMCLDGGFDYTHQFAIADAAAVADARLAVGLTALATAPANADPSASTNIILFGGDTGDTTLQVMHNDASGTATKVNLGANFPINTQSADWYRVRLRSLPGTSVVDYWVKRVGTAFEASGSITTNLPAVSTLLGPLLWRNNGATALAARLSDGGFMANVNLETA